MRELEHELAALIGCQVRLWDFSPSHDRLVLRLNAPDRPPRYLVLSGCEELAVRVRWRLTTPRISIGEAPFVEFHDDGVRIVCQDLSLHDEFVR